MGDVNDRSTPRKRKPPPKVKPTGRKPFRPTDDQRSMVRMASGLGVDRESICGLVLSKDGKPITMKTLLKHFVTELATGKAEAKTKVAGAFFKNVMSGNLSAQIFYLKTQCGWKEPLSIEHSGPDGQPLPAASFSPQVQVYLPAKDPLPT